MNRILRRILVFIFVIGISSIYLSNALWACEGGCGGKDGQGSDESGGHLVQIKAEGKDEKAEVVKDPVCGMEVSDAKKAITEEYNGREFVQENFLVPRLVQEEIDLYSKLVQKYTCEEKGTDGNAYMF